MGKHNIISGIIENIIIYQHTHAVVQTGLPPTHTSDTNTPATKDLRVQTTSNATLGYYMTSFPH